MPSKIVECAAQGVVEEDGSNKLHAAVSKLLTHVSVSQLDSCHAWDLKKHKFTKGIELKMAVDKACWVCNSCQTTQYYDISAKETYMPAECR